MLREAGALESLVGRGARFSASTAAGGETSGSAGAVGAGAWATLVCPKCAVAVAAGVVTGAERNARAPSAALPPTTASPHSTATLADRKPPAAAALVADPATPPLARAAAPILSASERRFFSIAS